MGRRDDDAFDATLAAAPNARAKAGAQDATLDAGAPPPGRVRAVEFPQAWSRYQYLDFLGEGGMGKVFKALDPRLKRPLAIKFVRGDDPDVKRRLLREATAQAHIEHPNVCKVYEVGEVDGRPFVAMQLIDGRTLSQLADELNLQEKLRVMEQVSSALAAAHALGVVHRDLKPSNVMCERRDDGMLVPFVMDFGLAHDPRDGQLSQENAVMGTPAFMSPEQARGDQRAIDARSDVYSLGATLYALLAGRPPFDAQSSVEVLLQVLNDAPASPRRQLPSVPTDVDTIVMKCLEKDPARRYGSARALAEDLRRYMAGEPILARPPSRSYRARLWLRRHRALAAVATLGALLVIGLGAWLGKTRMEARRLSAMAQRFGEEVKDIEQHLRLAFLLPEHDVTRDREAVRARLPALADEMARLGPIAEGPGHYAIGRANLMLGELDAARAHLERAWAAGYRHPEVAYALGAAWEETWQRERDEAARPHDDENAQRRAAENERAAREAAAVWLKQARGTPLVDAELLEAQIDYVENRTGDAQRTAHAAFEHDPQLFEARVLEGRALSKRGHKRAGEGELQAARADYAEAARALESAVDIARSDPTAHFQLCRLYDRALELPPGPGERLPEQAAVSACRRAVHVDPTSDNPLGKLAIALSLLAETRLAAGQDARALLVEAEQAATRALALAPRFANHYRALAHARRLRGDWDGALDAIERGLGTGPDAKLEQRLHLSAAQVYVARGRAHLAHGDDAGPDVTAALAELAVARAVAEDYRLLLGDAQARVLAAAAGARHGDATAPLVDAARRAIARTLVVTREQTPELKALSGELDRIQPRAGSLQDFTIP